MKREDKPWDSTNEQNVGIISKFYKFIKEWLYELQDETVCPNTFIYDLIGRISNERRHESCHLLEKNNKKNIK